LTTKKPAASIQIKPSKADEANQNQGGKPKAEDEERKREHNKSKVKIEKQIEKEYFYGWHEEANLPYRCEVKDGKPLKNKKEMGYFPEIPDDTNDDEFVLGKFQDGTEKEITDMTYARLAEIKKGGTRKAGQGPIWEGMHEKTKNRIWVSQRSCRILLMSLYEQSKQRLNVHIKDFGEIPPDESEVKGVLDNDHPTVKKAAEYVVMLAKKYASGELADVRAIKVMNYELYEKTTGKK
jgi:hypothetical protein